jgi:hypothetical protein
MGQRHNVQGRPMLLQPFFDLLTGETPLAADLETGESAIGQHAVDGDAIDLEQILQLARCQQIAHRVPRWLVKSLAGQPDFAWNKKKGRGLPRSPQQAEASAVSHSKFIP